MTPTVMSRKNLAVFTHSPFQTAKRFRCRARAFARPAIPQFSPGVFA
jgi:hypothetical protein